MFGAGNADAELMFIGEAPGANEDRLGLPFVGQAGKLLDKLLVEIGLDRKDVFIANTLKCRPPDNRDPHPNEIEACSDYLRRQVDLIEPTVICTLGNFATKLLRADTTGISRLHGQEEELTIGHRTVRLYPLYHPAAALYTPSTLEALRADFHRIPDLLALGPPTAAAGGAIEDVPELDSEPGDVEAGAHARALFSSGCSDPNPRDRRDATIVMPNHQQYPTSHGRDGGLSCSVDRRQARRADARRTSGGCA